MAKEGDLKKVELKVSVNCCDGCKKQVKKTLQSIEGVLRTEIDLSQPKVTITGNVDPQILIRKLGKLGKPAELWGVESKKAKEVELTNTSAKENKEKKKSGNENGKCSTSGASDKTNEKETSGGGGDSKKGGKNDSKGSNESASSIGSPSEVTKSEDFNIKPGIVHYAGNVAGYTPYYPPVELYYTVPTVPNPPQYNFQQGYYYEMPVYHPPMQLRAQASSITNYFSEENTVGCTVM
ncbi:uncharacterized protein LOC143846825 [Tasmannia lanceolata]|uniref:uncharacterized protein LOC143846825 n=1 Tax=Tasmannia lanceolata TaxID=3420 RepID=UPI00406408AA